MGRWPCSQRPGSYHLAKACVARTGLNRKAGTPWVPISQGPTLILQKCSKGVFILPTQMEQEMCVLTGGQMLSLSQEHKSAA